MSNPSHAAQVGDRNEADHLRDLSFDMLMMSLLSVAMDQGIHISALNPPLPAHSREIASISAELRRRCAPGSLSSGETPAEPPGLPPGESAQRNEVCDALAELIRGIAEIAEASGESPVLDIRRERQEGKDDGSLTVRALLRFMTTCDPEGCDGPYGELVQRTWRRVGQALSSAPPATEPGDAPEKYDQTPGGCWAACIAGLTGISHDQLAAFVPRLPDGSIDGSMGTEYHNAVNAYLRASGWRILNTGKDAPLGFAIGSGTSPRGIEHAVIVRDGELWHDPHESRAGIESFTSFEILVPLTGPVADAWDSMRQFAPACYEYAVERLDASRAGGGV